MKKNTLGYSEYVEAINEGGRLADRWANKENVYDAMTKIAKYTLSNKETPDEREKRLVQIVKDNDRIDWEKQLQSMMIPITNRNAINLSNQNFSGSGNSASLSVSNPTPPVLNNESLKLREDAANKDYKDYVKNNGNAEDNLAKQRIRAFYGLDNNYVSSYFNKFLRDLPVNFMKAIGL